MNSLACRPTDCFLEAQGDPAGRPTIYANDSFGRWRSDRNDLVAACRRKPGRAIIRTLAPGPRDYFVLKPKNSAFYTTTLELLLDHIGVKRLILAGWQGTNCILFTANDAYLRDYRLHVLSDCIASENAMENRRALEQMHALLKADVRPWREIPCGVNCRENTEGYLPGGEFVWRPERGLDNGLDAQKAPMASGHEGFRWGGAGLSDGLVLLAHVFIGARGDIFGATVFEDLLGQLGFVRVFGVN